MINASLFLALLYGAGLQAAIAVLLTPFPRLRGTLIGLSAAALALIGLAALSRWDSLIGLSETRFRPLPGAAIVFTADPFGLVMAALIAQLALAGTLYAGAYAHRAPTPTPAHAPLAMALATMGAIMVALSANLLTMFVAYVILALAAGALAGTGVRGGGAQALTLTTMLLTTFAFLMPAVAWTYAIAGDVGFTGIGLSAATLLPLQSDALLALFVLGLAMAALFPAHRWLTDAAAAGGPYAGPLAAGVVVAAGGAALVKVCAFVFGPVLAQARVLADPLALLALAQSVAFAVIALGKDQLGARLGYLGAAQMGLVVAGLLTGVQAATFGAIVLLIGYLFAGATALMAVTTIALATGRTKASQMSGLGRRMPFTFAALLIAALGLAGAPPLGGAWARVWLAAGAGEAGAGWAAIAIGANSILSFAALAPLCLRALWGPSAGPGTFRPDIGSPLLIAPMMVCAIATMALFVFVDPLGRVLAGALEGLS